MFTGGVSPSNILAPTADLHYLFTAAVATTRYLYYVLWQTVTLYGEIIVWDIVYILEGKVR